MKLHLTGVSHKTAPVEVRERLAFRPEALPAALLDLRSCPGVAEALILSTCNRVEITVTTEDEADPPAIIDDFLDRCQSNGACAGTIHPSLPTAPYLYRHDGREAIHHLFRVAASLDSMVIGEPQILGQLKAAYAAAKDAGAVCGWLDGLLTRAFGVAKRVRSETGIGQMAVSVSYAAVELARKIFGSLEGRTVMMAGAGKMSELTARHLRRSSSGKAHVFVTNRTYERAVEMAQLFQGTPVEYTRFIAMLPEVDILIASSAAPHYILRKEDMRRVMSARRHRPMLLIDIAVPRNIDPAAGDVDQVFLKDIDALEEVVEANLHERQKEAHRAEALVAEEVDRMMASLRVAEVTPTIVALKSVLEEIGAGELEKVRRKYGPLDPRQEEALNALTRGIVNKIAHGPITELRTQATQANGAAVVAVLKKVFNLQD
ncbi:MAG TPA: glutamyl-tRNA reductase [Bryobacteraceae bacterium]|nr:glutamyl-tRNA reductase [Bryobacteraceae bacterium]